MLMLLFFLSFLPTWCMESPKLRKEFRSKLGGEVIIEDKKLLEKCYPEHAQFSDDGKLYAVPGSNADGNGIITWWTVSADGLVDKKDTSANKKICPMFFLPKMAKNLLQLFKAITMTIALNGSISIAIPASRLIR